MCLTNAYNRTASTFDINTYLTCGTWCMCARRASYPLSRAREKVSSRGLWYNVHAAVRRSAPLIHTLSKSTIYEPASLYEYEVLSSFFPCSRALPCTYERSLGPILIRIRELIKALVHINLRTRTISSDVICTNIPVLYDAWRGNHCCT